MRAEAERVIDSTALARGAGAIGSGYKADHLPGTGEASVVPFQFRKRRGWCAAILPKPTGLADGLGLESTPGLL